MNLLSDGALVLGSLMGLVQLAGGKSYSVGL